MAVFTNIGKCRLVLPDGRGLEPGESAEVEASVLDYPVVAAWVDSQMASIVDDAPEPEPEQDQQPEPDNATPEPDPAPMPEPEPEEPKKARK